MKVGIFYNSISNPTKFSNKVMLMDNFAAGVRSLGDQVIEYRNNTLPDQPLDAGFVLGYTLEDNFRKKIINSLQNQKSHRIFVDSNVLHYAKSEHEWHRYSLNNVYPDSGVYFFDKLNVDKWADYSTWHNVNLKPWRTGTNQQHILILCQRPKGWNMFGNNQESWLDNIINNIRKIDSKRRILIRMHPGDGTRHKQIDRIQSRYTHKTHRIEVSTADNIQQDLVNCWCTVGYNSTPNVVARIEGVPGYVADARHSWAADVSFCDLEQIVDPPLPDRSEWIHKVANIHWSNQEVKSGQLWSAIRTYISAAR
jgi:hypothetical protein